MVIKNRKNIFARILFSQKFLSLIGLAVIILISLPFAKNALKQYRVNKEINDLKKEIADLQNRGADLKNFVSYLESDQFAEEQARLNLGLKKPGEELLVITDQAGQAASSSSGQPIFNIPGYKKQEPPRPETNPEKWLNYFLK